mgnify:CR=1 FL=1
MNTFTKKLSFLLISVLFSTLFIGCYTQLALETNHPYYRDRKYKQEKQQPEENLTSETEQNNSENEENDSYYSSPNPSTIINNYYSDGYDWWPNHRFGLNYYWPSSSFWVSYNDPWYNRWDYYYPTYCNYNCSYGFPIWCGTSYVYYGGWHNYSPWGFSYYPYWEYGDWIGYTQNNTIKTVRDFGRTRDAGVYGDRDTRNGVNNIGVQSIETTGGIISGSNSRSSFGNEERKNSGQREGTLHDRNGRYGPRNTRNTQHQNTRDNRTKNPRLEKNDNEQTNTTYSQPRKNEPQIERQTERSNNNSQPPQIRGNVNSNNNGNNSRPPARRRGDGN